VFFDITDGKFGFGAVVDKAPLSAILRFVGCFVNPTGGVRTIGDFHFKIYRLFRISFDINVSERHEIVCYAGIIARDITSVNLYPLGERHAQGQTKQDNKQKFLHQEKFSTKI
jgi:hypothetical protein